MYMARIWSASAEINDFNGQYWVCTGQVWLLIGSTIISGPFCVVLLRVVGRQRNMYSNTVHLDMDAESGWSGQLLHCVIV